MNSSAKFFRVLPVILSGIITAGIVSCSQRGESAYSQGSLREIQDTLSKGDLEAAARLTDALKKESLQRGDSLLWSESMVQQGINAYYKGNPEMIVSSTDSALSWLRHQKITPRVAGVLAKAYQTRGAYFDLYNFNSDSTAKYLRLSVSNVEKSGKPEELPQAYGNFANALRLGSSLDSAAIYYHRAISIADSLKVPKAEYIPLYNGIASVFTDMRDFDNSRIWWEKSMEISGEMNRFDKFNTFTGLGNDLYYQRDYKESYRIFRNLRDMLDTIPDTRWERMFTDVNLADTYLRLDSPAKASVLLDSVSIYFSEEQPNPVASSYIHTLQIRNAIQHGNIAEAQRINSLHPMSDSLRLEQQLARLQVLEELYSLTGDYRRAYEMQNRYVHLNDSLRSFMLKQRISTMTSQYHRDQRILNLQAESDRQQARIYRLLAAIAITLMIIIGLLLFIVLRKVRIRRREERMMAKIIKLREENLRNRITPHFIYNAINHELNNSENGQPLHLEALVGLIRRQQYATQQILVPFAEEREFVEDYIKVISDGISYPLSYTFTSPEGLPLNFMIPSMSVQILVENAFKHGFTSLPAQEERVLEISVAHVDQVHVQVMVFNNSDKVCAAEYGTGLHVLVETIRLLNERNRDKIEFQLDANSERHGLKGYTAIITIPISLKS